MLHFGVGAGRVSAKLVARWLSGEDRTAEAARAAVFEAAAVVAAASLAARWAEARASKAVRAERDLQIADFRDAIAAEVTVRK